MTWLRKHLYLFPVLFFLPALGNFFSADDWFHLRITQINSLQQFLNFFSFSQTPQSASFYRPLSTQVFFFVFQNLFGLNSVVYYFFGLSLFAYILYLIKKLSERYLPSTIDHLPSIIYGLSASNFTRVYFVSAFQELFLVVFSLLTLVNFKSKPKLSLLFFVLALMSKETAIVLPALVLLLDYKYIKNNFHSLRSTIYTAIALSLVYLNYRLLRFGFAVGDSYLWDFSPIKAANTIMWYVFWSLGAPELLVDYIGTGLKPIPRFFVDYPNWWAIIVLPLITIIVSCFFLFVKNFRKINSYFWMFIIFFVISLSPVLFLPSHKFALELGLPLVGFSIAVGLLIQKTNKIFYFFFLGFFVFYNLSMNCLTYTRHYSVSRGKISRNIYQYFQQYFPTQPEYRYFEFINDAQDRGELWGQSKQISQVLSGSDFLKVFYDSDYIYTYYQDIIAERPLPMSPDEPIYISTKQFLNQ